jgi:hypothetical protein
MVCWLAVSARLTAASQADCGEHGHDQRPPVPPAAQVHEAEGVGGPVRQRAGYRGSQQ